MNDLLTKLEKRVGGRLGEGVTHFDMLVGSMGLIAQIMQLFDPFDTLGGVREGRCSVCHVENYSGSGVTCDELWACRECYRRLFGQFADVVRLVADTGNEIMDAWEIMPKVAQQAATARHGPKYAPSGEGVHLAIVAGTGPGCLPPVAPDGPFPLRGNNPAAAPVARKYLRLLPPMVTHGT